MSKLALLGDGTIVVPVPGEQRAIRLGEPTLEQLAEIVDLSHWADGELKAIEDDDELETLRADAERAPHGRAMVGVIRLLSGEDVQLRDLPGWATGAAALMYVLEHYIVPLTWKRPEQPEPRHRRRSETEPAKPPRPNPRLSPGRQILAFWYWVLWPAVTPATVRTMTPTEISAVLGLEPAVEPGPPRTVAGPPPAPGKRRIEPLVPAPR